MIINYKIVGAGFSCLDIIKLPEGDMHLPGGTCANIMAVLAHLEWKSYLVKPEYNDAYNSFINEKLADLGVKIIAFSSTGKRTPRIIQTTTGEKHRFHTVCPVCNEKLCKTVLPSTKSIDSIKEHLASSAVFYYDRISSGIKELNMIARQNNILTFYEPNSYRNYQQLLANASQAKIIKFSSERVHIDAAKKLKVDLACTNTVLIIVTLGSEGMMYATQQRNGTFTDWKQVKGKIVTSIVDVAGAGDWLTAGLINSLVRKSIKIGDPIDDNLLYESLVESQLFSQNCFSSAGALGCLIDSNKAVVKPTVCSCQYCGI